MKNIKKWDKFNENAQPVEKKEFDVVELNDAKEAINEGNSEKAIAILKNIKGENPEIIKEQNYLDTLKDLSKILPKK